MTDTQEARWKEWDYEVAPRLQDIARDALAIAHLSEKICERCAALPFRPGFDTYAEDRLVTAIKIVENTLLRMQEAKVTYRAKGVGR